MAPAIPLADVADTWLAALARMTGSRAIAALDGATLLGERAMLEGFRIPLRVSAGGGCRLYEAQGGAVALNLARESDRDLLPALFQIDGTVGTERIAPLIATRDATLLVARGRLMGLAIAGENEHPGVRPLRPAPLASSVEPPRGRRPRVLDLSALWAGPLAAHLLRLAGAEVIKVESRTRPDAMRDGDDRFFALLNQGKASVVLDFADKSDRAALIALIAGSDIVIEAARPRALEQLGVRGADILRQQPGLTWVTITGHGAEGEAAHWVGFGDDCGVAAGLSAALRRASGRAGFVGDAIGDPLTGIRAASAAWRSWSAGATGRIGVAMSEVVAEGMGIARARGTDTFDRGLVAWAGAAGTPFPAVRHRDAGPIRPFGADTRSTIASLVPC